MKCSELKDITRISFNVLAKIGRNEFVLIDRLVKMSEALNYNIIDMITKKD